MNVVDQIRKIRLEKGIAQEAVAEYLKISQSAYSRLECQETVNVDQLLRIAAFLNVKPGELLLELNIEHNKKNQQHSYAADHPSNVILFERILAEKELYMELLVKRLKELEDKIEKKDKKIKSLKEKLTINNIN
ncbi:helix-turn-helix domain-containing protein [Pedobacter gandavensis]|uniref:Helix-turn-helix domain-containing protein n=1 Tax=Pedobacter gandavensis TaxID=2679963 RepID=A0ABR6EU21_9SPHI|nr:helix-turn-helix transcriptional regulator [Pedobacter gandavensis]MBB2148319.1 helix-turn-helix domain-containing protein [Pedobacter gandavensis]